MGFPHEIWGFPVNFPLNQSIEIRDLLSAFPLRASKSQILAEKFAESGDTKAEILKRSGLPMCLKQQGKQQQNTNNSSNFNRFFPL